MTMEIHAPDEQLEATRWTSTGTWSNRAPFGGRGSLSGLGVWDPSFMGLGAAAAGPRGAAPATMRGAQRKQIVDLSQGAARKMLKLSVYVMSAGPFDPARVVEALRVVTGGGGKVSVQSFPLVWQWKFESDTKTWQSYTVGKGIFGGYEGIFTDSEPSQAQTTSLPSVGTVVSLTVPLTAEPRMLLGSLRQGLTQATRGSNALARAVQLRLLPVKAAAKVPGVVVAGSALAFVIAWNMIQHAPNFGQRRF